MKTYTLLLLLNLSLCVNSQNFIEYHNLVNEAEWHYDNNRLDKAQDLYEKSIELVETPKTKHVLMLARIYSKKGEDKKIYPLIKKQFKKLITEDNFLFFYLEPLLKNYNLILSDKQFNKISSFKLDTTDYRFVEDMKVKKMLDSLCQIDQKIRKKLQPLDYIWWGNSTDSIFGARIDFMRQVDSTNAEKLIWLFKERELAYNNKIGPASISTLLLHMSYENFISIEEDLLEMVAHGNLHPHSFAQSKDRKYASVGECISYSAYPYSETNYVECISYDQILTNRLSIGLSIYYSFYTDDYYSPPYFKGKIPFKEYYDKKTALIK